MDVLYQLKKTEGDKSSFRAEIVINETFIRMFYTVARSFVVH